jgi:hypothetical protein
MLSIWRKFLFQIRRKKFDEDLAEEIRLHKQLREDRLRQEGLMTMPLRKPPIADSETARSSAKLAGTCGVDNGWITWRGISGTRFACWRGARD